MNARALLHKPLVFEPNKINKKSVKFQRRVNLFRSTVKEFVPEKGGKLHWPEHHFSLYDLTDDSWKNSAVYWKFSWVINYKLYFLYKNYHVLHSYCYDP